MADTELVENVGTLFEETEETVVAKTKRPAKPKITLPDTPCVVCAEGYNRIGRKPVTCPYCSITVCMVCVKHYLLETIQDPHCMDCRREWDREFIDTALTKDFRSKSLKEHREDILLDRERSLLPATQPIVEDILTGRRMRRNEIPPLEKQQQAIYIQITQLHNQINEINNKIREVNRAADRLEGRRTTYTMTEERTERRQFVRGCPVTDCRGFLSTAWKCGICETWVCPDCHEIKGKERDAPHTCKPEILETVKLLAADTKPCPKCSAAIFKVEGCDQMWCTQCQTAFSWRTGRIETGIVHNPHFYQWQRAGGAAAGRPGGEGGCGALPGYHDLRSRINSIRGLTPFEKTLVETMHQRVNDMLNRVLRDMPAENIVGDNSDLRISYLLDELTDVDSWKRELQKREKQREKRRAIRRVIEMFTTVAADLLHRIMTETRTIVEAETETAVRGIFGELEALRVYFNEQLEIVGKRFDCVVPSITPEWRGMRM